MAPWEEAHPAGRLYPLDQWAVAADTGRVVTVRVTPRSSYVTQGTDERRDKLPLVVESMDVFARAGRAVLSLARGRRLELLMLADREAHGLAVGDPARRLLTGRQRGRAAVAVAVPRALGSVAASPYLVYRSTQTSDERNEQLDELIWRVRAFFPDVSVGTG